MDVKLAQLIFSKGPPLHSWMYLWLYAKFVLNMLPPVSANNSMSGWVCSSAHRLLNVFSYAPEYWLFFFLSPECRRKCEPAWWFLFLVFLNLGFCRLYEIWSPQRLQVATMYKSLQVSQCQGYAWFMRALRVFASVTTADLVRQVGQAGQWIFVRLNKVQNGQNGWTFSYENRLSRSYGAKRFS